DDLRRPSVDAILISPLAGLQLALDVNRRPLPQILRRDLGEPTEERHAVPLRPLLPVACLLVLPCLARRDANVGNRAAVRHGAGFGICAEMADYCHFVDASHSCSPFSFF